MWICGEKTITCGDDTMITASVMRCKSWECETCFEYRLHLLKQLAASGKPTTFITLTASPAAGDTAAAAARSLVHAWRMIVQRAKREGVIDSIQYLCVFEETKQGRPHLHILARCGYVPQQWLSDRMQEYARSPIVDIRAIRDAGQAAAYIAKYVSKGPARYDGTKRYWRSMHWVVDADAIPCDLPVADHWAQLDPDDIVTCVNWYERHGWIGEWESTTRVVLKPLTGGAWPWLESVDRGAICRGKPRPMHPSLTSQEESHAD